MGCMKDPKGHCAIEEAAGDRLGGTYLKLVSANSAISQSTTWDKICCLVINVNTTLVCSVTTEYALRRRQIGVRIHGGCVALRKQGGNIKH